MLKHIEDKVDRFNKEGYIHLKNVIPNDLLSFTRLRAIKLKQDFDHKTGWPRHNGSGRFWGGLELASTLDPNLWKAYTSDVMYYIASKFLSTEPYLFNDQVVVKLPNSGFVFEEHADNWFGPDPDGALEGKFKTINCSWILTNMTPETGPLSCLNKLTNEWEDIPANAGDIVIIEGNTLHKSGENKTNNPRALYACVYSSKPLGKDFDQGYYYEKFPNK